MINHEATGAYAMSSQQVSWWDYREFAQPRIDAVGHWPVVGTPAWCLLGETDPAKWAAILDAAQHWALRVETCQQAHAEASSDISAAAPWGEIARTQLRHNEWYAARPWAKRRVG